MNLGDMRTIVRRDLHDEDAANYRWTDDELDRHIAHAVKDFSEYLPYQQKAGGRLPSPGSDSGGGPVWLCTPRSGRGERGFESRPPDQE